MSFYTSYSHIDVGVSFMMCPGATGSIEDILGL
jgi:hypothetical protein